MMTSESLIRRAMADDLEPLLGIAAACAEAPRWSRGVWRDLLVTGLSTGEDVRRAVFVAQADDDRVGFIVVRCAADAMEMPAEIESVAVLPALRRMGTGRALCVEAMAWARGRGAVAMELEVRAGSAGALAMYVALGFEEQGRRRAYYREPADDAVLMSATL